MLYNPLTGAKYPVGGMQLGMLSGQVKISTQKEFDAFCTTYLAGTDGSNKALLNLIIADAKAVGLEFLEYKSTLTGGYRVALVVWPHTDYHWYRDNGDGTWSHKPGQTAATNLEVLGRNSDGTIKYGNVITDPKDAGKKANYTVFVGYFYIRPLGTIG